MDSKDVFIHNLNTIMKDRRVSRKELAKGLNVPYTTLTDWYWKNISESRKNKYDC